MRRRAVEAVASTLETGVAAAVPVTPLSSPSPIGPTVSFAVHLRTGDRGRRRLRRGATPAPPSVEPGRVPRISRLLALAIRYDRLIREGAVRDYAELARLGSVSRARISQIMDLLNLAPEIQEEILFLARVQVGKDPVTERSLRSIACTLDWGRQRMLAARVLVQSAPDYGTSCPGTDCPGRTEPMGTRRRTEGAHAQAGHR